MLDPVNIIMLFLGIIAHILGTLMENNKKAGKVIWPSVYIKENPYATIMSIVLSIVAYIFLSEMEQLTSINAFLAGYVGDSIVKKFNNISSIAANPKV